MWTGIELLYPLQELRMEYPILGDLCQAMSSRIVYLVLPIMIVAAFYWTIDKKQGEILGLSCIPAMVFSMLSKYVIGQPRPWEIDPRIEHVSGVHANGPSLPSGHTAMTVSSFIPAAIFGRNVWFACAMIVLTSLVMFSRLILCVHTPLDIIAGLAVGALSAVTAWKAVDWAYGNDRRHLFIDLVYVALFTILFAAALFVWNVEMTKVLEYMGFIYGMILGKVLERRYVSYKVPDISLKNKAKIYVAGMLADALILLIPLSLIPGYGTAIGGFAMMLWLFYLYPKIIMCNGL